MKNRGFQINNISRYIHGDVKLANLLVDKPAAAAWAAAVAKLADFGSVKRRAKGKTADPFHTQDVHELGKAMLELRRAGVARLFQSPSPGEQSRGSDLPVPLLCAEQGFVRQGLGRWTRGLTWSGAAGPWRTFGRSPLRSDAARKSH